MKTIFSTILLACVFISGLRANGIDHLVFEPREGTANGKHIVLISGDEEYRSEESAPMLAKILSQRHGFKCTVLFPIDRNTGVINPNDNSNIPNTEALATANLMIIGTRWRVLPGEQLQPILDYLNAAKPVMAFRTATHAFNNRDQYGGYNWRNFGRLVVGDNWVDHHGRHGVEGGRGIIVEENADHPVLNNVSDIFTLSDIYTIRALDQNAATVLLHGAVTESLDPESAAIAGPKNDPLMPLAWIRDYPSPDGESTGKCFATTAGASVDFEWEDLRRLFVNAAYHLTGLEVPENANVEYVDPFNPTAFGFQARDYFIRRNLQVSDFALGSSARSVISEEELQALESSRTALDPVPLKEGSRIVLLGNGLAERMLAYGHFETELQMRYPDENLYIRNLSYPASTPGFQPHPSRPSQWSFPGAEEFRPEFENHRGRGHNRGGRGRRGQAPAPQPTEEDWLSAMGQYPTQDQWLTMLEPDVILAFYGFNESFDGPEGLERFKGELGAFVDHVLSQQYNGESASTLVLVSPIAYEDLSAMQDLPDGTSENANLVIYAGAMQEVAANKGVKYVDIYKLTAELFADTDAPLTVNGAHLNNEGYRRLAPLLSDKIFGEKTIASNERREEVHAAVNEKNWYWKNDYQMVNGVHIYGQRYRPFGNENYPEEIEKIRQMTANRDQAIWAALKGEPFSLVIADSETLELPEIETNAYDRMQNEYLGPEEALASIEVPDGYKVELFASEKEFPDLANPVQMSFDNAGRLWVSVMPSYPHFRPGSPKPNDKILILEDTDNDGKADRQTIFADGLSLPIGFEIAAEGVYVSQAPDLVLLRDLDGDDHADSREIILSGFDTHDTHHAISAFTADPSGAIVMAEGTFLHSNVESAYGPVRGIFGGFFRFNPSRQHLERTVQTDIPNPWGAAFDEWGQDFFLTTSSTELYWMLPVQVKARYGELTRGTENLVERSHRVRPTSGLEFISSRHFPDEVQGDILLNNTIGFLGAKQHVIEDDGTGYTSRHRQDLYVSSDPNFRPVDMEFAPDGFLYFLDWQNRLIGHMQHSARDPLRDHAHGRIYRVTYPSRPLVKPAKVAGASIEQLLENLKLPEYRTRYRSRRELRSHPADEVAAAVRKWTASLDSSSSDYERLLLEGLWVTWGANKVDESLLRRLLSADAYQARAAAVRVLRYNTRQFSDHAALLTKAANDVHGRVRLEAVTAASWLDNADGLAIAEEAGKHPIDEWTQNAYTLAEANLRGVAPVLAERGEMAPQHLSPENTIRFIEGEKLYRRDGFCVTCHQADGTGLPAAGFPPLDGTEWVNGNEERLIEIVLYGMTGPIEVKGRQYPGFVPMTQFGGLMNDEEIAAVLTYVRNSFGNNASPVSPDKVRQVRARTSSQPGFRTAADLLSRYQ